MHWELNFQFLGIRNIQYSILLIFLNKKKASLKNDALEYFFIMYIYSTVTTTLLFPCNEVGKEWFSPKP